MIRDAAYASLLNRTRQRHHLRIAQLLEEQFSRTAEHQPELLAYHFTEAGRHPEAAPYWHEAGQKAIQRSAHAEAVSHLLKGLELLQTLPENSERNQQELALLVALGPTLMAIRGLTALEVIDTYDRARELCQQIEDASQLFLVLFGLWRLHLVRGDLQRALDIAQQLLDLAQQWQSSDLLLAAHWAMGGTLFWLGEIVKAQSHLGQAIAFYDLGEHRSLALLYAG